MIRYSDRSDFFQTICKWWSIRFVIRWFVETDWDDLGNVVCVCGHLDKEICLSHKIQHKLIIYLKIDLLSNIHLKCISSLWNRFNHTIFWTHLSFIFEFLILLDNLLNRIDFFLDCNLWCFDLFFNLLILLSRDRFFFKLKKLKIRIFIY